MRVKELDPQKIANILIATPLLANQLGHKWLKSTYKSYILPDPDDLEGQFVRDLMLMDTETIIATWYGGQEEAAHALFSLKNNKEKGN